MAGYVLCVSARLATAKGFSQSRQFCDGGVLRAAVVGRPPGAQFRQTAGLPHFICESTGLAGWHGQAEMAFLVVVMAHLDIT